MAILSEGLTIVVGADTTGFRKGLSSAKALAASTAGSVKKSAASMVDSLDKVKNTFDKLRGIALFFGIALAALVAPGLKAEDSFKKLSAANVLAGKSVENLRKSVKAAAGDLGKTYAGAADKARVGVLKFAQTTKGALAGVRAASDIAAIGLADEASAFRTLAETAASLNRPLETTAEQMKGDLAKAAVLSGSSIEELGGSIQTLSRPALRLGTDISSLLGAIVALRKDGASLAESTAILKGSMQSVINPTEEQAEAWRALGQEASPMLFFGERVGGTMALLKDSITDNSGAVRTLTGDSEELLGAFSGFGGGGGGFVQNLQKMKNAAVDFSDAISTGRSEFDDLKALLPRLVNGISDMTRELGLFNDMAMTVRGVFSEIAAVIQIVNDTAWLFGAFGKSGLAMAVGAASEHMAAGGIVPGTGSGDKIPAMLEPGEFVVRKTVAQALLPFLHELNSKGIRSSALLNTSFARVQTKDGQNVLSDILNVSKPTQGRLPIDPAAINLAQRTGKGANEWLAEIAGGMFRTLEALPLRNGGQVPQRFGDGGPVLRMAAGGPVPTSSTSSGAKNSHASSGQVRAPSSIHLHGNVNMNVTGREITPTVLRDTIVPGIEREAGGGRSRRSRSRR